MRPRKDDEALVDVLDVLLRDGAIVRADVIVSVADIPLVGIKLSAAIAGMETMTEYGLFETWDLEHRRTGLTRRQYDADRPGRAESERIAVGATGRNESVIDGETSRGRPSETPGNGNEGETENRERTNSTGDERGRSAGDERESADGERKATADDGQEGATGGEGEAPANEASAEGEDDR